MISSKDFVFRLVLVEIILERLIAPWIGSVGCFIWDSIHEKQFYIWAEGRVLCSYKGLGLNPGSATRKKKPGGSHYILNCGISLINKVVEVIARLGL